MERLRFRVRVGLAALTADESEEIDVDASVPIELGERSDAEDPKTEITELLVSRMLTLIEEDATH